MSASDTTSLRDLPLTALPSPLGDTTLPMVVYLSGDGGWNTFSQELTRALTEVGIPVGGIDALRYFRKRKSPPQVAEDIARVAAYYQPHW